MEADNSETLELPDKPSIAVLPFVNMSSDPEQEFFSDGISEEILNALTYIPNLKVAARTSASTERSISVTSSGRSPIKTTIKCTSR